MALDTAGLKAGIKTSLDDLFTNGAVLTSDQARTKFSNDLGTLIETFVKSGDGHYQAATLTAGSTAVTAVGGGATVKIT